LYYYFVNIFIYFHRNVSSQVSIASPLNLNIIPPSPSTSTVQYNIQNIVIPNQPLQVPTWSKTVSMFEEDVFNESNVGVTEYITSMSDITPTNIFLKLFPETLLEHVAFHTNLYATQAGKPYIPTTPNEIKHFFAINMFMSLKKLPSYRDYWSSATDFHDNFISKIMPVNRFGWILSHLHFNDNSLKPKRGEIDYDKLYKIRPLLNCLSETFKKSYRPHQKLAVDESMVKFKGRCTMKQYMQNKPIKRGFKIWMLCDQSSYNLKFEIYTGKCSSNVVETGLGAKIVLNLMNEFAGKNHIVYMDNYFSSYNLYEILKQNNIYAVGTVNSNRKNLPKLSDDKKMMRGDFDWNTSDTNITMCKWKDKRSVHLLSSRSLPQEPISVKRKQKDGTIVNVPCPQVLVDYNKNMNYVDNFDRLKGDYSLDRKSVKWYMRLVFHFVDCAITNAFIIHKELPNVEHFKNKNFKRNIYNTLLSDKLVAVSQKSKKTLSQGGPASRKPHINKSIRLESSSHQPQRTTSRRCGNCSTKKNPVRSIWECSVCKVSLCMKKSKNCFQEFHLAKGKFIIIYSSVSCVLCYSTEWYMFSCFLRHINYLNK